MQLQKLLTHDLSLKAALATRLYNQGEINDAYKIASELVHKFGFYKVKINEFSHFSTKVLGLLPNLYRLLG